MEDVGKEMKKTMDKHDLNHTYQSILKTVYADSDVKKFVQQHKDELDADAIEKSASKLYEFVNEKNKIKAGKNSFAKGYQPNLVVNDHLIEVSYAPTQEHMREVKQHKIKNNFKTVGMTDAIKDSSLNGFEQTESRVGAFEKILDFIKAYESDDHKFQKGLYLYGPFGVGKTYLLAAMANRLSNDGYQTLLLHFPSFAVDIKNSIGNNQVASKLDIVKESPVLIIDDIGADSMSSWIRDDILGVILEYRMQHELSTFFSSNFSMKQLEDEHLATTARGDIEPLKAKRLMERIKFLATSVEVTGKNRRNS